MVAYFIDIICDILYLFLIFAEPTSTIGTNIIDNSKYNNLVSYNDYINTIIGGSDDAGYYFDYNSNETDIIVSKSEYKAKLIKVKPDNFYEILNKKIIERRN